MMFSFFLMPYWWVILPGAALAMWAQYRLQSTFAKYSQVGIDRGITGAQAARPHQTLYWRYGPQWAVRHGDMKLVVSRGGGPEPELYNLADDIGESKNLASAQPAKVKELQALWNQWSAEQAPPNAPDGPVANTKKDGKKKVAK